MTQYDSGMFGAGNKYWKCDNPTCPEEARKARQSGSRYRDDEGRRVTQNRSPDGTVRQYNRFGFVPGDPTGKHDHEYVNTDQRRTGYRSPDAEKE